MKKILVLLLFLFAVSLVGQSQDKNYEKETKKETKEEFIIPENKVVINEMLEEIKEKITDSENKLIQFNNYSRFLENYKNRVSSFDPNACEQTIQEIETLQAKKSPEEEIREKERELITNLRYIMGRYYEDYDFSTTFLTETDDILKVIDNNALIIQIRESYDKSVLTDNEKIKELKEILNAKNLTALKTKLNDKIVAEIENNKGNIDNTEADIKTSKANKLKLLDKLNEQETQINNLAIKLGLPFFCLTILFLFLGPKIIHLFRKTPDEKSVDEKSADEKSQNVLLELCTVLLLTMSILILGLSGKIQSEVLGTLIGGISGYVLNRIRTNHA